MKKFIKIAAAFMVPVVLLCAVFAAVLWRTGETADTQTVYEASQNGTLDMFGFAYRDNTRALKHEIAAAKKADVLVLGTSRSMQLHSEFFNAEKGSFYNAGGGIAYATQAQNFLETLPDDALPQNLILVLDQYFYNEIWATIDDERDAAPYEYTKPETWYMLRRSMEDYLDGKYSIITALKTGGGVYGISAAVRGAGFYADGSYSYGTAVQHPEKSSDAGFADTLNRIALYTNRFEYGDAVNAEVLARTRELLAFCAEKGIKVTAFLPPYAPTVWQTMQSTGQYSYIDMLLPTLQPLFDEYGFEIFDYTYLDETADEQYIDGFHGSDRVYAEICVRLSRDSALLDGLINASACEAAVNADGNPLTVDFTVFSQ